MATLSVDGPTLTVRLTTSERVAALHGDLRIPLARIRQVESVADPVRLLRGLRAPGLGLPSTRVGSWSTRNGRTFAAIHRRRPGLRITLDDSGPYRQILLSVPDPDTERDRILASAPPARQSTTGPHDQPFGFRSGEITLAGTLSMPAGSPTAVALLLNGSGPIDRDGNARQLALGVSRGLARALAAAGCASLRYDKRGVGASGGSTLHGGLNDLIADAAAATRALAADARTAALPLVVVGHSEGALVACALAAGATGGGTGDVGGDGADGGTRDDVADDGAAGAVHPAPAALAGVVLLAATAKTGEQTLVWQLHRIVDTIPRPTRVILRLLRIDVEAKQRKSLARIKASSGDVIRAGGRRMNARWMREFLAFDARPLLPRIGVPVLAVTGAKDLQVDPDDLAVIAESVAGPVRTRRIEDLTHVLRRDPKPPTLKAYRSLVREPVDAEVLALVSEAVAAAGAHG